jgi:alkanesulfonate monooxygenase SsuD/methylene tetrahydromethanopterin reductase-like flavin-dependent oxidoreductase (luciferase family)
VGDHFFLTEGHYKAYSIHSDPSRPDMLEAWTILTSLAMVTEKLRIGTSVTQIPARHPSVLAKTVMTADIVSGGRVIFGVGMAPVYSELEITSYGLVWDEFSVRAEKTIEAIEVIKKLWTEDRSSYNGKYFKLKDAPFWPKPIQKPHPPIWFSGSSNAMIKAAARLGDGWLPRPNSTPEFCAYGIKKIEELKRKYDRADHRIESIAVMTSAIDKDREIARERALRVLMRKDRAIETKPRMTFEDLQKTSPSGTPEDCIVTIEKFLEAGVRYFILLFIPTEFLIDQMTLFAKTVIPRFAEY